MISDEQTEIGLAKGKQDNIYENAVIVAYGMLAMMAVLFVTSVVIAVKAIILPTISYEKKIGDITQKINSNNGDLTERVTIHTADEVGKLVRGREFVYCHPAKDYQRDCVVFGGFGHNFSACQ